MRTPIALILALSATLTACGGADPKAAAYEAFQSGDYAAAVTSFNEAMTGVDTTSPEYLGLAVARCEALAHTNANDAKDSMIALADAQGGKVTAKDYNLVAQAMVGAREFAPAILLLDDGIQKRFKDDPKLLALVDKINTEAEKSGDEDTIDALKGLGYVGGD
ncbi:MAG: tetraacyldisaccharide-1-P 4'-kinase [Chlamydiales bacterium]|jgi:tetraacyldisaccharide-1-P 4'-kinase